MLISRSSANGIHIICAPLSLLRMLTMKQLTTQVLVWFYNNLKIQNTTNGFKQDTVIAKMSYLKQF
jgi:hypothetical protein